MSTKLLPRASLSPLLEALIGDCDVIGPKDEVSYGELDAASDLRLSCANPRRSLKQFFYPDREVLLRYRVSRQRVEVDVPPAPELARPRVLFGAHPCDVAALPVLDKLFSWDYLDSTYLRLREQTTIITIACDDPPHTCFCTSVGGSPAGTAGTDILLSPLSDTYHVQIVSAKGGALVERYVQFFEERDEAHDIERERLEQEWRSAILREVDAVALEHDMDFDSAVWETLTQQCIDCGICTYLCPTCHCFDIQDEGTPEQGCRVRLWDACAFKEFTESAAHQPRPRHFSRYRQRIMHKFQYYPHNFSEILCVGCGRCISHCPASIDLRRVLEAVKE